MEIKMGKSCGSCIHTNKPKKPREHAAHYETAKTERWCFNHNCHVTRETTCEDHEGVNRGAKTAFTRTKNYNKRQKEVLEVIELIGDKPVFTPDKIFFVKNNWLYYIYGTEPDGLKENPYNHHYPVKTKESSSTRYINLIKDYLN